MSDRENHTPLTPFRIPPSLKARAQARARREGVTLTSVVLAKLEEYAADEPLSDTDRPQ